MLYMSIEVALLISAVSLAFALYKGISDSKRNHKKDVQDDTTALTTVIVKLETISNGVTEIKSEMNNIKSELKESRERIIKVEESSKQAHKRLDSLESRQKILAE